jgi:hypothetical protein
MEHSVYYVASPEACAAILWKSRDKAGTATEALRITSSELVRFGVMDEIVREPLGAAHSDPVAAFPAIKEAILNTYRTKYEGADGDEIRLDRYAKFRKLGMFEEFLVSGGRWREAREARAAAGGARTAAGTWAPTADDAALVEAMADADEAWGERLRGNSADAVRGAGDDGSGPGHNGGKVTIGLRLLHNVPTTRGPIRCCKPVLIPCIQTIPLCLKRRRPWPRRCRLLSRPTLPRLRRKRRGAR